MGSYQNESLISTRGFQTEQTFWRVFNKNLSSYKSFGQLFGEGLDETLVIDRAVSSPGTADWKNRSLPTSGTLKVPVGPLSKSSPIAKIGGSKHALVFLIFET